MSYAGRLLVFAAVSMAAHLLLARGLAKLPARPPPPRAVTIQVRLQTPPPPPEPPEPKPPEPEPTPEPPSRKPTPRPPRTAARVAATAARAQPAQKAAPTERPASGDATGAPVFGVSMESTSQGGAGPAVPVGNTLAVQPKKTAARPGAAKPLQAPVPAYEVTKMPLPKERCTGTYTEAARRAGLEGTVVLDLVVGEDGRVREIVVVRRLGHGLTEAAVAALKRCRFAPGERDGKPVPVRVRGFKVSFYAAGN
jgi:periplasmic protein TonB